MNDTEPMVEEELGLDDVIEQILKTDDKAKLIAGNAKQERSLAEKEIEDQKKELKAKFSERAQKRIEALEDQEEALAKERIAAVDSLTEQKLQKLNAIAVEKRNEWAEKIYARVLED